VNRQKQSNVRRFTLKQLVASEIISRVEWQASLCHTGVLVGRNPDFDNKACRS